MPVIGMKTGEVRLEWRAAAAVVALSIFGGMILALIGINLMPFVQRSELEAYKIIQTNVEQSQNDKIADLQRRDLRLEDQYATISSSLASISTSLITLQKDMDNLPTKKQVNNLKDELKAKQYAEQLNRRHHEREVSGLTELLKEKASEN